MAKKAPTVEVPEAEEVTEITTPKVFTKRAYSVFQKGGEYHFVCVSFNDDLEVGSATIMESSRDLSDIEYSLDLAVEQLIYE